MDISGKNMKVKEISNLPVWSLSIEEVLQTLETRKEGLTILEAKARLRQNKVNKISEKPRYLPVKVLIRQFENWLIVILAAAALISFFLGERVNALVIIGIVGLSVFFSFLQEYKAEKTLLALKRYISHKVRIWRDSRLMEIDATRLVPGDIILLRIGDVVPADIRLFKADNLTTDEASLTGESMPIEKNIEVVKTKEALPQQLKNMALMGTTISGGRGIGVVVTTGRATFFGKTAEMITETQETEFQREIKKFSSLLMKVILGMTVFVFLANAFLKKGIFDSFLFAVALAVGIAPEMLPAIITVTLSQGALKIAKKKVIVKRLVSVEDLGNIDTLCTDKTGTLSEGKFELKDFLELNGQKSKRVLFDALLCLGKFPSNNQVFLTNPIDKALWENHETKSLKAKLNQFELIDENEFDFERKRASVLAEKEGKRWLIAKGAPEAIISISSKAVTGREEFPLDQLLKQNLLKKVGDYEESGLRVLLVAEKEVNIRSLTTENEKDMTILGYLLFEDPVKKTAKSSLALFKEMGVQIKILSGDSEIITKNVAKECGVKINSDKIVSGAEIDTLDKRDFEECVQKYNVFARVTPEQKYRIVKSLKKKDHLVGFLGDGINDAPALRAADVGIAVDSGAEIAKEAADIILLKKDLQVIADGIDCGRKTFGNLTKYILNTISANYGNMFTVALSSLFLKFIPLLPSQILLNNFISDIPLLGIATDNVDEDFIKKPKRWNVPMLGKFMVYFGLISSFFDLLLILPMLFLWQTNSELFRTAWFVESSLSEILITFSIRTRFRFYKSAPSPLLVFLSIIAGFLIISLPFAGIGGYLFNFVKLPTPIWGWIGFILFGYFLTTEMTKKLFFRKFEHKTPL